MKALLRAPSASISRNRFGIRNATKKASSDLEAPNMLRTSETLTRPLTLLSRVPSANQIVAVLRDEGFGAIAMDRVAIATGSFGPFG